MPTDNALSDPSGSAALDTEPLACVSCRARKLKCDRTKPACSRCVKVSNECVYPESRRKPTFKRRNVKELEARLAQVEDYLKEVNKPSEDKAENVSPIQPDHVDIQFTDFNFDTGLPESSHGSRRDSDPSHATFDIPTATINDCQEDSAPHDTRLMDLGQTEALPPFEVLEELNTLFFQTQYYFIPVVHPRRYLQAFYASGPLRKPPMCLQYMIWALAAMGNAKYDRHHEVFYQRARQYANADEMKGTGEHFITISHAQTWVLISSYEAKCMLFTRAATSSSKAIRLAQMMGLDRLDGSDNPLPPTLAPPVSWAELEERRRVFWGTFTIDAHASIATGWPNLIQTEDIETRLPASEAAFINDRKEEAPFLEEIFDGAMYSGFSGTIVICQVFKMILKHVHRTKPRDHSEDVMHGEFWNRHRDLDNKLSSLFMFLPEKLRLPENIRDPTAAHTNLNLHASIICLHHAAIEKVDKYNLPDTIKQTSILRLRAAAEEVVHIMKMTSHATSHFRSPLCAVSLYSAATVYIYIAKQNPTVGLNAIDVSNLGMVIQSMEAIARNHDITRAFLQQVCADVENNGLDRVIRMPTLFKYRNYFGNTSDIPLLLRSSVSQHSEVPPVLPGRLPLGNPKGSIRPSHLRANKWVGRLPEEVEQMMGEATNQICFSAILGAVTRNIREDKEPENSTHKRKRASQSPGPDVQPEPTVPPPMRFWNSGRPFHPMFQGGNMMLPDRTTPSSASSPANQGSGTGTGTEAGSGSSHTSPGIGLGNTAEENRVDLRAFQDRISTPIWQSTEDTFMAQINDTMIVNSMSNEDAWGILNADINWDIEVPAGPVGP